MKNLLILSLVVGSLVSCKESTKQAALVPINSPKPIAFELAARMVANYTKNAGTVTNNDGQLVSNTRAVWLDINELDAFVSELKKERDSNNVTDGVRVYFGTYGDNKADNIKYPNYHLNEAYSKLNSLVFVSTKDSVGTDNKHYHSDYYKSTNKGAFLVTEPQDKGELCPPPSKCCATGAGLLCPND